MLIFSPNRSRLFSAVTALFCVIILELVFVTPIFCSDEPKTTIVAPPLAFQPGEVLKYEVSWSNIFAAGIAVLEVREEMLPDGKPVLSFIVTGRSKGLVNKIFPVRDRVQSIFDPEIMQSLSYNSTESFGKKKRRRSMVFDREQNTVVGTLNDEPARTVAVPAEAQDGLAFLYYLRTRDFIDGKVFSIDVHDSGKNWSIEVQTVGRERIKTPAGEFSTIKLKTRSLREGASVSRGEAFIWLTDDSRKVPVLMKSSIKVGSFVFTLKNMEQGGA